MKFFKNIFIPAYKETVKTTQNLENTIQINAQSRNDNTISNYENRIYTEFAEYKDFSETNYCHKKAILSIVAYIINNTENVTDLSNSLREEAEERNKNVVQKTFAEGLRYFNIRLRHHETKNEWREKSHYQTTLKCLYNVPKSKVCKYSFVLNLERDFELNNENLDTLSKKLPDVLPDCI
jgi:hypothetical protein